MAFQCLCCDPLVGALTPTALDRFQRHTHNNIPSAMLARAS
jgi:hypothetical protein